LGSGAFRRALRVARLVVVWSLPLIAACGGSSGSGGRGAGAATKSAPPAKVTEPRTEASLTTITLTEDAVRRLGIETGVIGQRGMTRTRTISGDVMAPGGAQATITAPFAGRLESGATSATASAATGAAVGATVAKGTTIFRLVALAPSDRDARIEAERAVSEAEGLHAMSAKRAERAAQLARDGSGSRRASEEAEADLVRAAAALKAARDRLALASRQMNASGAIALDAPYSALLRAVHANPGQTVAAGAPLFDLVRLDTMWIRVPIFGAEADDVDPRAAARIVPLGAAPAASVANGSNSNAGKSNAGRSNGSDAVIARPIDAPPSADPNSGSIDLYYAVDNARERFRPGQRVGVVLSLRGDAPRLVAPRAALLYDANGGSWVYEMRDAHTFVRRRVDVADIVGDWAVITQGPPADTRVVTAGAAELFGTEFGVGK
jgi:RND family efflux transporter MFP subunit